MSPTTVARATYNAKRVFTGYSSGRGLTARSVIPLSGEISRG
jgi:hypothetical protein